MMYLLDTNVVSELRKVNTKKANANVINWANGVSTNQMYLSVISVLELELGVLLKQRKDPEQGKILRTWLDTKVLTEFAERILVMDLAVVQQCAKLHVPDPRSDRDTMIAATALVHDLTVVTRNTNDFRNIAVKVLNPWE